MWVVYTAWMSTDEFWGACSRLSEAFPWWYTLIWSYTSIWSFKVSVPWTENPENSKGEYIAVLCKAMAGRVLSEFLMFSGVIFAVIPCLDFLVALRLASATTASFFPKSPSGRSLWSTSPPAGEGRKKYTLPEKIMTLNQHFLTFLKLQKILSDHSRPNSMTTLFIRNETFYKIAQQFML